MKPNYPDASQVWQRVHPPEAQQPLQILLQQLIQDLAYLKQQNRHQDQTLLQQYAEQLQCLKGILMLSGSNLPRHSPVPMKDHSLRRCYDHALQRLSAYQLRSADPVYGPVFRDLARQTEHHCCLITQLLGK